MKPKTKIEFDELDIKCLTEMPLILDVISSTGNKITRLFSPLYSEMNELIKSHLKPNWQIDKKSYDCQIFPLTFETSTRISIKTFEQNFKIESAIILRKIVKGKEVNYFWAYFGYNCFSLEGDNENQFFFIVEKGNVKERYGGTNQTLKFYSQIKNKLSDYNIEISHPEKGDDTESIVLIVDNFSIDKIQDGFNTFKQSILTPFLKSIE